MKTSFGYKDSIKNQPKIKQNKNKKKLSRSASKTKAHNKIFLKVIFPL